MAFNVISNITLDMKHAYSVSNIVQVNQYDTAGVIKAQLLNDGAKWSVPQSAKPVVMFKKTDNIGGFYDVTDTDPETAAVSIDTDRSIIYISLDPQTTTTATSNGKYVDMQVAFFENGLRISTFAFYMQVLPSVITSGDLLPDKNKQFTSSWIFNILSKEIADTLTVATTPDAMTEWLEDKIGASIESGAYAIDDSLTVPRFAADAEATGKMVVVSDQNPNRTANKVWVKKTPATLEIPTMEDVDEVNSAFEHDMDLFTWIVNSQMIDKNNLNVINGYISGPAIKAADTCRTIWIPIENNTDYTLTNNSSSARFNAATSATEPAVGSMTWISTWQNANTNGTQVFHSGDANYIAIFYYNENFETKTEDQILSLIKLEKGDTSTAATTGYTYGERLAVEIVESNLDSELQNKIDDCVDDVAILQNTVIKDRNFIVTKCKRTAQLFNKYDTQFYDFYINGSGEVSTGISTTSRAIVVPVSIQNGEYYTLKTECGTNDLPITAQSTVRFATSATIPQNGDTVIQFGVSEIGATYLHGSLHASSNANYAIFMVQFKSGTAAAQCDEAIATIADSLLLINTTPDSGYDYDADYVDYYIVDVQEDNLSDTIRTELAQVADGIRPIGVRTINYDDNILTDAMITLGTNWSGTISAGFTHTSGSDAVLTAAIESTTNSIYLVEFDIIGSSDTVNSLIYLSIGDSEYVDTYNGTTHFLVAVKSVNGGSLLIKPYSSFSGKIENLQVYPYNASGENSTTFITNSVYSDAPDNDLTGFWNIGIGLSAMQNVVSASRSIALGTMALNALVSGTRNIGIGTFALNKLVSGDRNISIGADSSYKLKKGTDCIAIGMSALLNGTNRNDDIAIGNSALAGTNASTSAHNIGIGKAAGFGVYGINNVMVGAQSGMGLTSGNNNTLLGYGAGKTGNFSDSIAVGKDAIPSKSNQMVLGSTSITEVVFCGNKKILFNQDGTVTWEAVT